MEEGLGVDELRLMVAAFRGRVQIVALLLGRGADVNARTASQATALHFASVQGHINVVRLLLAQPEVKCNLKDSYGRTPLMGAVVRDMNTSVRVLAEDPRVELDTRDGNRRDVEYRARWG